MLIEEVKRINLISKQEYPITFEKLLHAGVLQYRTSVSISWTVYVGEHNRFEETNDTQEEELDVSPVFSLEDVKKGLQHHQLNQTPYSVFLKDMAEAGVHYYEVDFKNRLITYTSDKDNEFYTESVPSLNIK